MDFVARTRKAWIAAVGTAGPTLAVVQDGGITVAEAAVVAGAFLGAFLVAYLVPNRADDVVVERR